MPKKITILFLLLLLAVMRNLTSAEAQRGSFGGSSLDCPLDSAPNRIIVGFGTGKLRSDKEEQSSIGPVRVSIPAGTYRITLASNDPSHPAQEAQPQEMWFLRLTAGEQSASSNPISDLADSQVWKTEVVNSTINLTFNANEAIALHYAYPSSNPNSIVAVCAALDSTNGNEPLPTPVTPTPNPSAPPGASCTISMAPSNLAMSMGGTSFVYATITNQSGGPVNAVTFSSSSTSVAHVTPIDTSQPYRTTVSAVGQGSSIITATGYMNGAAVCMATSSVQVGTPLPWWQVINGDVTTNGNLISPISNYCEEPDCKPYLIRKTLQNSSGVAVYGGAEYDFSDDAIALGDPSEEGWLANTTYLGQRYDYGYLTGFLPTDVVINPVSGQLTNSTFTTGTAWQGYYWYRATGETTINSDITIPGNRKVVLLVEGGNLRVRGRITIANPATGFFMAIVGRKDGRGGDMLVEPAVTSTTTAALQGIFVTDGQLRTGLGDKLLWFRGSVIVWGGMVLQRDLGNNNMRFPAEVFEYDPRVVSLFPDVLKKQTVVWKEVAP